MLQQLAMLFNLSGVLHFHHLRASGDNNICSFGFSKSASSFPYSYSSSREDFAAKSLHCNKTFLLPLSLRVAAALELGHHL